MKAYIAEGIGTFLLTTVLMLGMTFPYFGLPVPVLAALTLSILVLYFAKISGAHVNPAITIGLLSISKISQKQAALYIVFQVLGAVSAQRMVLACTPGIAPFPTDISLSVFFAEGVATAVFAFGVAAVATTKKIESLQAALTVGGSLLLGICVSLLGSNGILNPAVAFAVGSSYLPYFISPVVGAVVGMQVYTGLFADQTK